MARTPQKTNSAPVLKTQSTPDFLIIQNDYIGMKEENKILSAEYEKQIAQLKYVINNLKKENEELKDGFTKEEASKFLEENEELKKENKKYEEAVVQSHQKYMKLKKEKDHFESIVKNVQGKVLTDHQLFKKLKKENKNLHAENKKLKNRNLYKKLRKEIAELKAQLSISFDPEHLESLGIYKFCKCCGDHFAYEWDDCFDYENKICLECKKK